MAPVDGGVDDDARGTAPCEPGAGSSLLNAFPREGVESDAGRATSSIRFRSFSFFSFRF
jgi:hypothetical protein